MPMEVLWSNIGTWDCVALGHDTKLVIHLRAVKAADKVPAACAL